MNKLKCDYCGGTLYRDGGLYKCEHCGTAYENEDEVGEKKTLCTLAFEKLRRTEFDEADEAFTEILASYGDCFEAYWGKLLAKYGVVFVDDIDGKKVPTCFDLIESVTNDALYKKVLALCPKSVRSSYVELAEKIEKVRAEWAEKASKEPAYDIFICYKESDIEGGIERTADSVEASNLYTYLVQKGYRVFYSRETLRGKVAEKYEPYIFGAIQTAPVMIVYGQKREYFESTWVKNEWLRFIKRIEKGQKPSNGLIVAYEKMNAYDLPARLKSRQCMNAGAKTFYTDLVAHIERVIKATRESVPRIETVEIKGKIARRKKRVNVNEVSLREPGNIKVEQIAPNEAATLKTGYLFLEKGMWKNAAEAFNKALAENNFCGSAVWGGILSRAHAKNNDEFKADCKNFTEFSEFARAVSCADAANANEYIKVFYDCVTSLLNADANDKAAEFFSAVVPYKCEGRNEFIDGCLKIAINKSDENLLESVLAAVDPKKVDVHINAMTAFADRHLENGDFDVASAWYNKVLSADEGEVRALRGHLKCGIGCRSIDGYDGTVINLTDFPLFERLLSYCPSVSGEVESAVDGLLAFGAGSAEEVKAACALLDLKKVSAVFDRLVGYYPKADTTLFILSLYKIANIMLTACAFDEAERYFAMIVTESQKEYRAYWGLLKAKIKCATDKAVTRTSTDITEMGEFNSAVAAATMMGDEKFAETCIEISAKRVTDGKERLKQEKIAREQITVFKQRVIFNLGGLFLSAALSVAAIVMSAVMLVNGYEHGTIFTVLSVQSAFIVLCVAILFNVNRISVRNEARSTVRLNEVVAAMKKMRIWGVVAAIGVAVICFSVSTAFIGVAQEEPSTLNQVTYESEEVEGGIKITNIKLDSTTKVVEIPSSIWGKKVVELDEKLFRAKSILTHITIPSGVESIGTRAFYDCKSLIELSLPDSIKTIGRYAFEGCVSLESITLPSELIAIDDGLFNGCAKLKSISLPESITSIGDRAFLDCAKLKSITMPKSMTSIGANAFNGCASLTSITIPSGITTIEEATLYNCSALKSVTIPSGITSIETQAFEGCRSLTSITIPDSVTTIGNSAFSGCIALTSITIPRGVTSIGNSAFSGCSSLTSITIPHGVTTIGAATLYNCSALRSVTIPSGITSIGIQAFYGCASLTSVTIPSGITTIGGYAFSGCSSLTSITIPDSVTTIGNSAFSGCSSLTSVTIPSGVASIEDSAFSGCSSLTSVTIPSGVTTIGGYAFSGCASLTSITIPSDITTIEGFAFNGCASLTSITIPSSVNSIGNSAFYDCSSLTSVTIGDGVTSIGEKVFGGCRSLESISLPFVGESASGAEHGYIGYIFGAESFAESSFGVPISLKSVEIRGGAIANSALEGCTSLTSVTIGDGVTSIGYNAFKGCSSLESISLPFVGESADGTTNSYFGYIFGATSYSYNSSYVPVSLKSVEIRGGVIADNAFSGCSSLTSVTIGAGVNSIDERAFNGCASLTSVTIPSGISSIEESAFRGCSSLTSVTIPSGVASIGDSAFNGCASLTSVTIPSGVTSIGNYAFYGCSLLASITIPRSVATIGDNAFEYCSSLTSVTIGDGVTSIGERVFGGCRSLESISLPFVGESADGTTNSHFGYIFGATSYSFNSSYVPVSLKSVEIRGGVIANNAFRGCSALASVTILSDVTSIGVYAFNGCSSLTSIAIGDGVTSIGDYAFNSCSALTSVTIPSSVMSIGNHAFIWCSKLDEVYYAGTDVDWANITIGSENTDLLNATRYYFSATQPEEEGNYWHYGEDGITPVKWESLQ